MKPFRNPYKYQGGWVQFLAAAAPLVGAAVDWFSGERAAKKQRKYTKQVSTDEAYGSVTGRVEAAKAAGLHPAAALGTPSSSGMSAGGGLTDFRSAVTDATNSYTQQRQWRAEQEYARAQAADQRSNQKAARDMDQTRLNADLAMTQKQMSFIDEQIRASREESIRRNLATTKALQVPVTTKPVKAAMPNQYIPIVDRFGKTQYIPNPDIYDLELPSAVGAGTLVQPEVQPWTKKLRSWWEDVKASDRQRRANPYNLPPSIGD